MKTKFMIWIRQWFNRLRQRWPTQETLFASRWLKPFAPWFNHECFWKLNQARAASAVAVGLFCGLMPGPTQMLSALLVAYVLRTNLPLAILTTLYTNPLTYLPLYYLAYKIGSVILSFPSAAALPTLPQGQGMHSLVIGWDWIVHFGKPLLVGVPVLGSVLAVIGYGMVWFGWRWFSGWHRHGQ
ncbi:DUF2062 domain-containing protein [Neisseriaceae bacterium ESL0693]|nr:DUF2062 domain-containing protein [Neisseriaceae bacterium ESL0693]